MIYVICSFLLGVYMKYNFLSDEINEKIDVYNKQTYIDNTQCKYSLYVHVVPQKISNYNHDKYYVGITSKNVNKRWANGSGYKTQMFYRAIQKYGWDNIEHIVLSTQLPRNAAEELESSIISYLNSNLPQYGYNIATGGLTGGGNCKKVAQYDLNGKYINSFASFIDAARAISNKDDICSSGLVWATSEIGRSWHGYMWRTYDSEPPLEIEPYQEYNCRIRILQYDLSGKYIKTWNSLKEVSDFYDTYSISNACRKLALTAVGYQWRYENDNSPVYDIRNWNLRSKTIYVYTIEGEFINCFPSISEAVKCLNIKVKQKCIDISSCYSDIRKNYSHGYRWCDQFYKKLPPLLGTTSSKIIVQIRECDNKIINIYKKIKDAITETNESYNSINRSCKENKPTKRGFFWKYIFDITDPSFINDEIEKKYYSYI